MRFAKRSGMRVLVVDESPERADILREGLRRAGCEVTASLSSLGALLATVEQFGPDVIVIHADSASRDVLEHLVMLTQRPPLPVVVFASDKRIETLIEAAVVRFEDSQRLREELSEANRKLSERKVVERAKGLLMKSRGLDEEAAYSLLRKFAMDRKLRVAEVAQQIVEAADLLGA